MAIYRLGQKVAGGVVGVTDYDDLSNRPQINSVTLSGDKSSSDLGLQSVLTFDSTPTQSSTNPVTSGGVYTSVSAKQDIISSSNKVSADNIDDSSTTNKFVTSAEKTEWGAKVSDITLNGTSIVDSSTHIGALETVDNVTSAGNMNPLTANQGKLINDRINNISSIGRFLALWDCTTGQPTTQPASLPYAYNRGDYYIVSVVGDTNYMPDGTSYTGTASTTITQEDVAQGDVWYYDGIGTWALMVNHVVASVQDVTVGGVSVVSSGTAIIPNASASVTGTLSSSDWSTFNAKQNALTWDSTPTASSSNPVTSEGIRTAIDNKVRSGTSAPSGTASIGDIYVQYSE